MKNIIFSLFLIAVLALGSSAQNPTKSTREAAQLLNRGDVRGAIGVLDKAIEDRKDLFEAYKMRAFLRPMTGDFAGAVDDLSKAIEIKPDEGALYERRAWLRSRLRQDGSLILKDLDLAIAYGRKVEKVYTMRATVKRDSGDLEGAINDYQTAIGLRLDFAQAHVGLALAHLRSRDEDKAVAVLENFLSGYENSLVKNPKVKGEVVAQSEIMPLPTVSKDGTTGVSTIVIQSGAPRRMPSSPEEAEKINDQIEQAKNTAVAYTNLAGIYERRGELKKAMETIEKALAIDATDAFPLGVRGKIKSSQKDYAGAVEDLNVAIAKMPFSPQNYLERGIALLMLGREAEAQKDF
ncbi:MAG TPA: tetratricopeptide repeat protein, partial [Pyrinomonadaceae bacterium]|nr:tetratricopeptide repeat protein [Pyrinomonadaceae bacterium]